MAKNGYPLNGLSGAYEKLGNLDQARRMCSRFEESWKHADITLKYSEVTRFTENIPLRVGCQAADQVRYLVAAFCGV